MGPPADDDEEELTPIAEVRAALRALGGGEASLEDVLTLVNASLEREVELVPRPVIDAAIAVWESARDFFNGGADQFCWNHGVEATRQAAAAFSAVGGIENGELLARLADELEAFRAEHGDEAIGADPVTTFLAYRRRVDGPFFGLPEPKEELGVALVEYVVEHADALPDPEGPLPGFDDQ